MDPETAVDIIVDAGILAPTKDGESFTLMPKFREGVEARRKELESLDDESIDDRIESAVGDGPDADPLRAICTENTNLLAALEVLVEIEEIPPETRSDLLPAVETIRIVRCQGLPTEGIISRLGIINR